MTKLLVLAFGASVAAYFAVCSYMALSLTQPPRRSFRALPEQYGLPYENVSFESREDHLRLDGWLLSVTDPSVPARRPVVVVHGRGVDRSREANGHILEIGAELVRRGHPVLLFDLRGSGRSGGERFTLGAQEVRDVGGAIDYLDQRGMASRGVNLLGYSMGGATALLLAADEPLVRAVVEDSAYAELGGLVEDALPKASGLPGVFTPGMMLMVRPLVGVDLHTIRPIDGVSRIAARGVPLLVIHGGSDSTVPIHHGRRIAAAYGAGVETLWAPGAEHVQSYESDPPTYLARVIGLFERAER